MRVYSRFQAFEAGQISTGRRTGKKLSCSDLYILLIYAAQEDEPLMTKLRDSPLRANPENLRS